MTQAENPRKTARRPRGIGRALNVLALVLAAVAGTSSGCTRNRITVDIDVKSFVDPAKLTGRYESLANLPEVEVTLEPIALDVSQANPDFLRAEEMDLDVAVVFDNETGRGEGLVTVYLGASPDAVFDTPPVTTMQTALAPGASTTATAEIHADARVLELFRRDQVWMGLILHWSPGSSAPLAGTYTVTRIHARVVTRANLL